MLKKLLLPTILLVLIWGFWYSPDFKTIAAGVAIFLFGMTYLEDGFKVFAGGALEKFLKQSTNKLYKSMSFGFVTTTMVQSSSLVSLLTISFLSAGFIGLYQGIGIVLGANIGTTTGAWLMALFGLKIKLSVYAMPLIVFGFILGAQSKQSYRGLGYIMSGIGFLFLGIHYMKEGFEVISASIDFASFTYEGYLGIFIFAAIGIGATVVMQSSHATIILTLAALLAHQITYESALGLVLGANVGTTITAILGAIGSTSEAKKLAAAHFLTKFSFVLVLLVFIYPLIDLINWIAPKIFIGENDWTLKVALFDSVINIFGVLIVLPFIGILIKFLNKIFPQEVDKLNIESKPKYVNKAALETSQTILEVLVKETKNLYDKSCYVMCLGLHLDKEEVLRSKNLYDLVRKQKPKERIRLGLIYSKRIKPIYSAILDFATVAKLNLEEEDSDKVYRLKLANRKLVEAVKSVRELQRNIIKYSNSKNPYVSVEYDNMRFQIANMLKDIYQLDTMRDDQDKVYKQLKLIKKRLSEYTNSTNIVLDKLIREHLIDSDMTSSLINDTHYTKTILKNLFEMAGIMAIDVNSPLFGIESKLKLEKIDIEQLEKSMDI